MAMGLAASYDLELVLTEHRPSLTNLSKQEKDNEQNLSRYPSSKSTHTR
jgi:hypothetical protein